MAKLIDSNPKFKRWALTACEDYVAIDAYLRIKRFVPNSDTRFADFEHNFFNLGNALADKHLLMLNSILTRKGEPVLTFVSGHSDSHSATKGFVKAEMRVAIRDALGEMSPKERAAVIEAKRMEARAIEPRDVVYDVSKANRNYEMKLDGTVKVAATKLSEKLKEAVDTGVIPMQRPKYQPPASAVAVAPPVVEVEPEPVPEPRILANLIEPELVEDEEPSLADMEAALAKKKNNRSQIVRIAMLQEANHKLDAQHAEIDALKEEILRLKQVQAENIALRGVVDELEGLKLVIDGQRNTIDDLQTNVRSVKRMVMKFAQAA